MVYERFTDRAKKVMQLANQEAQRFNHEYIGTEHILLGLAKEGSGVAAYVLKNLDVDLRKIRSEVGKFVQSGPKMVTIGRLPQTPRAKNVIEYSMEEARNLNHNYLGTEHILLGLLREQEGVAAQVLINDLGLKLEEVREEILNLLGLDQGDFSPMPSERDKTKRWWQITLREMLLCTLIVAIGVGWWADKHRTEHFLRLSEEEARREAEADYPMWQHEEKMRLEYLKRLEAKVRELETDD